MIDIATDFMNSGTDFASPLKEAFKVIMKDKYKDGDIVFVTDGESSISNEFLKDFNKKKKDNDLLD